MASVQNCIYCDCAFNPARGQGDHILPAAVFGEFEEDRRFRGACSACNNRFGRSEQVLAQCTHLGFYRGIVRPNLGSRRNRGSFQQRSGAHGFGPPLLRMRVGEHAWIAERSPDNPRNGFPVDQLVVTDSSGEEHCIRLFPEMSAERLRSQIQRRARDGIVAARFQCDQNDTERFRGLLTAALPGFRMELESEIDAGNHRLPARIEFRFGVEYFQALAKIAFHYYLVWNRRGLIGNEPIFAGIRDFILRGGDQDQFFTSSGRAFWAPFGTRVGDQIVTSADWCHVLAVNEQQRHIVVALWLYLGPEHPAEPSYITLGRASSSLIVPSGVWGHVFEYQPDGDGGTNGRVSDLSFFRVREN